MRITLNAIKMRIQYLIISCLLLVGSRLYAQKPPIDVHESGYEWPSAGGAVISNDGRYFLYGITNQPVGSSTLVIRATDGNWKTEINGLTTGSFTEDSKKAVFMKGDSLCLLTLGTGIAEYVPGTAYFQQFKQGRTEWLAIQKSNEKQDLLLRNLNTGQETTYPGVSQFLVSPAGNALVLISMSKDTTGMQSRLTWLNLFGLKQSPVFETRDQLSNIVFDKAGSQLAFMISETNGTYDEVSFNRGMPDDIFKPQIDKKPNKINTIYRYEPGMNKAELWVDAHTPGINAELMVSDGGVHFSTDGKRLLFKLEKMHIPLKMKDKPVMVEVWSYKDAYLQSEQEIPGIFSGDLLKSDYVVVINKKDNKVIRLQGPNDYFNFGTEGDDFIIVNTYREASLNPGNDYWKGKPHPYMVSTINGSRKLLPEAGSLSPSGKYLYYFDTDKGNYFTYEIKTGITRNITAAIPFPVYLESYNNFGGAKPWAADQSPLWLKDDDAVLIGDNHDIWQVDPKGTKPPINITNGYGRKHAISLRYITNFGRSKVIEAGDELLLGGYRQSDKEDGYFRKKLGMPGDPVLLAMGPYQDDVGICRLDGPNFLNKSTAIPVKARDADVFIFNRQTEQDAPNLYLTKDFKKLTRLTDLQPQKRFNWYTTELVNWKKFDGKAAQGILYKPENFDPKKKYPLIFWYYEKNSSGLHSFLTPEPSGGDLNIPYFVSNGYLVFVPDITYKLGSPGDGAYDAVVSAARYLARRAYVNVKKMGITGHSFGGFETNYIVTRTSMFAAALAANGPTDLVSGYGTLAAEGGDLHGFFEHGQMRMGKTLWQDPQVYINSSPIFRANKVTTPLLLMHTKKDGAVRWTQAVEWFTALRRLNKKVWLLQYDNEKHVLVNPNNTLDYTIRMKQFFDYYLKDAPAPKWMREGVPAKMKGIDDGLQLQ